MMDLIISYFRKQSMPKIPHKTDIFPICFKRALVLPFHKGRSFEQVENYEAKCVSEALTMILEKLILQRWTFSLKFWLTQKPFGFRQRELLKHS